MQNISIYEKMTNAEKEVAKLLKDLGIKWNFEQPVFVWDENKRPRVWAPDFFLISFGIYVEVCGSDKFDYNYRKKVYKENGYNVIFLHVYKESYKWKKHFIKNFKKLLNYRRKRLISICCD